MNDALLMQILNGGNNLSELSARFFLLHPAMHDEIVEDFPARRIFHHKIKSFIGLNHLKELNNVWVIKHFHYANLKGSRERQLSDSKAAV